MTSKSGLRVLFVTSEIAPYSKTGGLADISASLPAALKKLGLDVRVLTPKFGFIDPEKHRLRVADEIGVLNLEMGGNAFQATFFRSSPDSGIATYFVDNPPLFGRPGLYVDPFTNRDYLDNDYRFIFLSQAALAFIERGAGWVPDIIHVNDWQSALAAFYLHERRASGKFLPVRSVLTLHNMAYQGHFGAETISRIGNGASRFFYPGGALEFYGLVNFLKAGIEFADALNSVSPTYAREIQSAYEFGFGLETVLRAREASVSGILNGIDTELWDPETDPFIVRNYTSATLEDKAQNTRTLCAELNLRYDPEIPVMGMISRIVGQKGFEILVPAIGDLQNLPVRLIILGTGEPHYEHVLRELAAVFSGRMCVRIGYDERLSHLIEAGADLFIMPSKYEPCGLNQMMSMRYGTLPVVRRTGGLADTVVDAVSDPEGGTGFVFDGYSSNDLLAAVRRASEFFKNPARWRQLQRNAMSRDFSWTKSAEQYISLYESALARPPRVVV